MTTNQFPAFVNISIKLATRLIVLMLYLVITSCASSEMASTGVSSASSNAAVSGTSIPGSASTLAPSVTAPEAPARPDRPVAAPGDYLIGPQDLLKVEVFGVPDLNRSVRVSSIGQISLPLIGSIQAAGLTGEQLAAKIAARLAEDYLQNPQVTIFIEEFTSQRVAVTGAVKSPNVFPIKGRTTLLQVVAAAGGPTSVANLSSVRILRTKPGGTRQLLEYDLKAIRDGEALDPEVQGEDVVQVDSSTVKETAKEIIEFIVPFRYFTY